MSHSSNESPSRIQTDFQWDTVDPVKFCLIKATLSCVEESLRYPLVLIKTHQQVAPEGRHQTTEESKTKIARCSENELRGRNLLNSRRTQSPMSQHPSTHQTFKYGRHLYQKFGVRGLFRGYPWYVAPAVPANVLYFYSYNEAKYVLSNHSKSIFNSDSNGPLSTKARLINKLAIPAAAGIIADAVCLSLCYECPQIISPHRVPFEIISQHLQLQDLRRSSLASGASVSSPSLQSTYQAPFVNKSPLRALDLIRYIWNTNGIRGFYRGFFVSLAIHTPSSGVWWASYEYTKHLLNSRTVGTDSDSNSALQSTNSITKALSKPWISSSVISLPENISIIMVSGAIAGASASLVSNPLDVIKTRLQTSLPICPLNETSTASNLSSTNYQHGTTSSSKHNLHIRRGFLHHFSTLLRKEGISGFCRGYIPRICVSMPTSAVSLFVYELALKTAQLAPSEAVT